jgi:hypothetical protein
MANTLAACRNELRLLLGAAGVEVHAHIPERVVPPVALLEPGSPYMEQGDTFCDFIVRMNVVLLVRNGDNDVATAELDALICLAVDAVDTWDVQQVEQPAAFDMNGATYLGARVTLRSDRELTT